MTKTSKAALSYHQNTPQYSQVPGWNKKIKSLHSTARYAFLTWVHNGRPKYGVYFEKMKVTRKKFKLSLRHCRRLKEQHKSDALATALQSSSLRTAFWKKVRAVYRKDNNSIPLSVGNATGQSDVANMWKSHYSGLLNSASGKSCDKIFVDNFLTRRSSFCNIINFQCTAPVMCNLIKKLPLQKSAGADGITAEHLRYAHNCVCIYLSALFNLCVSHGFIPEDCLITDIIPILKCKNKDATNVGNYKLWLLLFLSFLNILYYFT